MQHWSRRQTLLAAAGSALAASGLESCASLPSAWRVAPELDGLAPAAPREFRAAWVATVANIDWPSRKGLSSAEQQAQIRAIVDRAAELGLNALILQVRTSADAFYPSALEPWSEYLTGTQGQAPEPFYDPLALWIELAHARGMELHAWFNPFRARQSAARSAPHASHVSQSQPGWVKTYGDQLWMDPGEAAAAEHTLAVFEDVLQRYDVDGIHIDDYFYPYPVTENAQSKTEIDFPDQPAWQRYLDGGGTLERADWRRDNVNRLVERIYGMIRSTKPWVQFGISPFGLGRPDLRPAGIQGFSQYHKLYADIERWLQQGTLDYLVPQLYWRMDQVAQAFVPLLDYWNRQNTQGRNVYAGMFTSRIAAPGADSASGWAPVEISKQIAATRERAPGSGHVHFSMVALMQNRQGLADTLRMQTYTQPALVPASPWLGQALAALPVAQVRAAGENAVTLQIAPTPTAHRWALWLRYGEKWQWMLGTQPITTIAATSPDGLLNAVVVSALNRASQESPRLGLLPPSGGKE